MKKSNKIIFSLITIAFILLGGLFFTHKSVSSWRWNKAAEAAGGLPYQIGLTNVKISQCAPSCCTPATGCTCCMGNPPAGALCAARDVLRCSMYSGVMGTQAGGAGNSGLFLTTSIGKAGLAEGGQLIAGGMSMTEMDQGVLASGGGCFGCTAKTENVKDKIYSWLEKIDKFIIAGFKGN